MTTCSSEVRFYSVADFRADFLPHQVRSLHTFLKDPFSLTVLDNVPRPGSNSWSRVTPERLAVSDALRAACAEHGAGYARVPQEAQSLALAGTAHASALKWALRDVVLAERPAYAAIIDFDVFLCAPFSVADVLRDADLAGWPQSRGLVNYLWPGLLLMALGRLPAPGEIDLGGGRIDGQSVDVGGRLHHYLTAHPEVRVKALPSGRPGHTDKSLSLLPSEARGAYESDFGVDVLAHAFVHYRAGSGWDYPSPEMKERKTRYVFSLVDRCISGEWRMP